MQIDTSTDFGKRVQRRLREEEIIWLTTVGADGTPQPSPVWFLWDGESVLIFSKPETPKVRNIRHNANVSLHLDSDGRGGDIIVLTGTATVEPHPDGAPAPLAYRQKYAQGIKNIGMTEETMLRAYSTAIHILPTHLRGH